MGTVIESDWECSQLKEQIKTLTAERDQWQKDCRTYYDVMRKREDQIVILQAERAAAHTRLLEWQKDALTAMAERDALKSALENADSYESEARRLLLVVTKIERKNDRLRSALEGLCNTGYSQPSSKTWEAARETLAKVK